jgi:hypothetical protein
MSKMASRPVVKPFPGEHETARRTPNGYVYRIAGDYGSDDAIPPTAIVGAWRVDARGEIVGEFMPNPNFRPEVAPAGDPVDADRRSDYPAKPDP